MSKPLKAVLFDFDGTLTVPGGLDFGRIRDAMGCPPKHPVLEFIRGLRSAAARRRALRILHGFEAQAAAAAAPNAGAEATLRFLKAAGIPMGILTRNSRRSVRRALRNFARHAAGSFAVVVTRDDRGRPKPHPDAVRLAARRLHVKPEETLVVGDYRFDVEAGHAAGARTALLVPPDQPVPALSPPPDHVIRNLAELNDLVQLHRPLKPGKLPNRFLEPLLAEIAAADPSVLVGPAVGEDVAVVRARDADTLVLKSDPITFATASQGRHAVTVNANDVATCGARPRWLLATLLMPPGTTPADIGSLVRELAGTARQCGLTLCGGHTEVTDSVTRPVVVGHVVGTVSRRRLVLKRRAQAGDAVLLSKSLAVEGTSIIAREMPERLRRLGMSPHAIARCRALLDTPGISVLAEARLAAARKAATAMHDVTEGGLATAVEELSAAIGRRIVIDLRAIPVFPETRRLCHLLGLNPLGLIGSGSLLVCCKPGAARGLMARIRRAGIAVARIGRVGGSGHGVSARAGRRRVAWPRFDVDEIARLFRAE